MLWPDKNARLIARLFRDDPNGWTAETHWVRHRSGIAVWVANSSFALEVEVPGAPKLYGFFFPVGTPSQILIWWAFKAWRRSKAAAFIREAARSSSTPSGGGDE